MKSIPSRMRFMIQSVIDLRRNKWTPKALEVKADKVSEGKNASSDRIHNRKFFECFHETM